MRRSPARRDGISFRLRAADLINPFTKFIYRISAASVAVALLRYRRVGRAAIATLAALAALTESAPRGAAAGKNIGRSVFVKFTDRARLLSHGAGLRMLRIALGAGAAWAGFGGPRAG